MENESLKGVRVGIDGVSISQGITAGKAFLFKRLDLNAVSKHKLPVDDISAELERLDRAITISKMQLKEVQSRTSEKINNKIGEIFQSHLLILEDQSFLQNIRDLIIKEKANSEYIINSQIKILEQKYTTMNNEYMRNRFLDIEDVYNRLLRNLLEIEHVRGNTIKRIDSSTIFVTTKLIPSDIMLMDFEKILGILIEEGSEMSHVAIIAKALGVPAVIRLPGITSILKTNDMVMVDGYEGKVIVNPDKADIINCGKIKQKHEKLEVDFKKRGRKQECITRDGVKIRLEANVSTADEAKIAFSNGAKGIGLFRTEFYYMSRKSLPTIEDEFNLYSKLLSIADGCPVTIRLLDLGADKTPAYLNFANEENSQLGIRGIRFLLKNKDIFIKQLRSIIRASKSGNIRILIPFISIINDLEKALCLIDEICMEEKVERNKVKVGIMAEVPSVVLSIDSYIKNIDFISIGTNDLSQYIFAACRENGELVEYRQAFHPLILRLIKDVISCANTHNKEVSICGEIATNPLFACLLVGMGAHYLSMQHMSIPVVLQEISKKNYSHLKEMSEKALKCNRAEDILALLKEF